MSVHLHPTAQTTVTDLRHLARPTHVRPADHSDRLVERLRTGAQVHLELTGRVVEAYRAGGRLTVVVDTDHAGRLAVEAAPDTITPA